MTSHLLRGYVYEDECGQFSVKCECCDLRFEQLGQLQEHHKKNYPKITELPAECLTKIFTYLAPNELLNLLQVCTKFKATSEKVFQLYCDPGPIEISYDEVLITEYDDSDDVELSTQLKFVCRSKYEIAFPSLIQRLIIPFALPGYKEIFEFIRTNCSKKLISLIVNDCYCDDYKDEIYGGLIEDQLRYLEHLRVKNASHKNLYEQLLQYSKHLKVLNVINYCLQCRDGICSHYDVSWINHSYPELESIFLHTTDNRFDLVPMILRHPKLRNVACTSVQSIQSIFKSNIKFNYIAIAFLTLQFNINNFRQCHKDFVRFGRSKKFEKFELCFAYNANCDREDVKLLEQIPNVTGLHWSSWYIKRYTENGAKLPSIEKLCMYIQVLEDADELLQAIDECFPNLSELRINATCPPWDKKDSYSYFKYFTSMLSNSLMFKNLRQVHYENDKGIKFTMDDLHDINLARSSHKLNPHKITVYLHPEHFHKFNENTIELQYIEIKPWIHGSCELCVFVDVGS